MPNKALIILIFRARLTLIPRDSSARGRWIKNWTPDCFSLYFLYFTKYILFLKIFTYTSIFRGKIRIFLKEDKLIKWRVLPFFLRKFKRVHCLPRKTRFLPFPFFQKYTYSPKKRTIWEIIWHFSNLNFSSYWILYLIFHSFSPFFSFFLFFFLLSPPLPSP